MSNTIVPGRRQKIGWADKFTGFKRIKEYQNALADETDAGVESQHAMRLAKAKRGRSQMVARRKQPINVLGT